MTDQKFCSICQLPFTEYGNNAYPVNDGRCCDRCNMNIVIKARINQIALRATPPASVKALKSQLRDALKK